MGGEASPSLRGFGGLPLTLGTRTTRTVAWGERVIPADLLPPLPQPYHGDQQKR